ncbi:MAG: hypothetical protein N2596_00855 [Syntrophorhabdaceae bacterium]|nr:hypothetical protein [Syntrophorhabdaceae bacterium]
MQNNYFLIIGTIHRDESFFENLFNFIENLRPQVLTLELSYYGLSFREKKGDHYIKMLNDNLKKLGKDTENIKNEYIEDIKNYLNIPYEYRVASTYIKEYGGALYLVDMDIFSYFNLKDIDNLISEENLKNLLTLEQLPKNKMSEVILARLYFEKGIKTFQYTEEMRVRDEYMCHKIMLLMKSHQNESFLHICGWQHLPDPYKIYEKLKPEKVFIYDKTIRI